MSNYTKVGLPWSFGKGVTVSDCKTSLEVMTKAKLDWQVKKCEIVAKMPFSLLGNNTVTDTDKLNGAFQYEGSIYRPTQNAYATYRTDKNIPLGIVKSKYQVVQNTDAFNFFDTVIGEGKALWRTAGYFGYGEKVYVVAQLPFYSKIMNDEVSNYLVFSNSHDGSSGVTIMFTPIRVICSNMLNAALSSAASYIRFKHTQNIGNKLHTGSIVFKHAMQQAKTSEELYNSLYKIRMTDDDVLDYVFNTFLTPAERDKVNAHCAKFGLSQTVIYKRILNREYLALEVTEISMRKANQIASVYEYYFGGIGQKEILGTAWGAYNAITGYYSNVANLEGEKRMDSLLYGSANSTMQRALCSLAS